MVDEVEVCRVSASAPVEALEAGVTWTIALAGGEGGEPTPTPYRYLVGPRSPLEHTLARLHHVAPPSRTLTVINPVHRRYALAQLEAASDHVFCQPGSRGTGLAVYVALAMIKRWCPNATVTISPTDHFVAPSVRYIERVQRARDVATRLRDTLIVLGARPNEPDPELGYLCLGSRIAGESHRLSGIEHKPSVARATELIAAGALWNTKVVCGTVDALWALGRSAEPRLLDTLDSLVPLIGAPEESEAIEYVYRAFLPVDFSRDILQRSRRPVVALDLGGVEWSDWGRPERIATVLALRRSMART
ncbi:MAG: sugar phosphate nucleotidyltransferase [Polyangiales bacterium]